jgi:hypothetical protein
MRLGKAVVPVFVDDEHDYSQSWVEPLVPAFADRILCCGR